MACPSIRTGRTGGLVSLVWASIETPGLEWPLIEGWLRKAAERAPDPPVILDDGEILIVARRMMGDPPIGRAVGAATVRMTAEGEVEVILAGGAMEAARPVFDYACKWGRFHGATALVCGGRPGWARVLPLERDGDGFRMELR